MIKRHMRRGVRRSWEGRKLTPASGRVRSESVDKRNWRPKANEPSPSEG